MEESLVFDGPYNNSSCSFKNNEEVKVETLDIVMSDLKIPTGRTRLIYSEAGISSFADIKGSYETLEVKVYLVNGQIAVLHDESEVSID